MVGQRRALAIGAIARTTGCSLPFSAGDVHELTATQRSFANSHARRYHERCADSRFHYHVI